MSRSELEEILDLFKDPNEQAEPSPSVPGPRSFTIDEIAERIGSWLKVTDNPPRHATIIWKDLAGATADFALGVWAYPALMTGWSDSALFAIDEGLIPHMARVGVMLMKLDSDGAAFLNGKGEIEFFRRPRTAQSPWWQDPRVSAHQNTSARAAKERK